MLHVLVIELAILSVAIASPLIQDFDETPDFGDIFQARDRKITNFGNFDDGTVNDDSRQVLLRQSGAELFPDPDNYEDIKAPLECGSLTCNNAVFQKNMGSRGAAVSCSSSYDIPDTAFPVTKGGSTLLNQFGGSAQSFNVPEPEEYTYTKQQQILPLENSRSTSLRNAQLLGQDSNDPLGGALSCSSLNLAPCIGEIHGNPSQLFSQSAGMKMCPLSSPLVRNMQPSEIEATIPDEFDAAWAEACKKKSKQSNFANSVEPIGLNDGMTSAKGLENKLPSGWEPVELAQIQNDLRRMQNIR